MINALLKRSVGQLLSDRSPTRKFKLCLVSLFFAALTCAAISGTSDHEPRVNPPGGLTYDDGDLFIGFRATDRAVDYLVNIKQPGQFLKVSRGSTFQVNTGNLLTDLVTAFGSDWYSRIDPSTGRKAVLWAVVGGRQIAASGDPGNTLYSTNPSSTPWPRHSETRQAVTMSLIAAMGTIFANGFPTPSNPNGTIQIAATVGSYASLGPGFQTWTPTNEGVPNANLYLDRITPGTGPSTSLGHFTLNNGGQLTFHAATGTTPTNP